MTKAAEPVDLHKDATHAVSSVRQLRLEVDPGYERRVLGLRDGLEDLWSRSESRIYWFSGK